MKKEKNNPVYVFIDLETKSKTDLKSAGAWRYSEDPDADTICIAWAIGDGAVHVGKASDYTHLFKKKPAKDFIFVARNAQFEYAMFCNVLIPKYGYHADYADPDRWLCTADLSRMHGLPASLGDSAAYLNKKYQKLADGMRLILAYSIPVKNKKTGTSYFRDIPPDDWKRMLEYNELDVLSDREAFNTLIKLPNVALENETRRHNLALNARGVRIDTDALGRLLSVLGQATDDINNNQRKVLIKVMTKKGEVEKPLNVRSPAILRAFLKDNDLEIEDCKVETIEAAYDEADERGMSFVKKVIAWRLFCAKASIKKFRAMANRISADGRLRYNLKYFGGHTGRYSSEGVQLHNLPKVKWADDVKHKDDAITKLIRDINGKWSYTDLVDGAKKIIAGLIIPDSGKIFIAGDFAAVEARGIAWLAGCKRLLKIFRDGGDPYVDMAKEIDKRKPDRQLGKRVILGCGYGMGSDKFDSTCKKSGMPLKSGLAERAVDTYRTTYPEIPAFWYALEDAFRTCLLTKQPRRVGLISFERGGNYIRMKLPNGRYLYYHQARIENSTLTYTNFARKGAATKLWGGVLAENATQALCRDVLVDRMHALEKQKLPVVLHVHDEIVVEVSKAKAKTYQKQFDKITNTSPEWAKDFPLKTESEIIKRYHK